MFAPWCPTCSRRMLLGARRVESIERGPTGPRVVLRCHCDTLLVWSSASEQAQDRTVPAPEPAPVVPERWAADCTGGHAAAVRGR